MTLDDLRRMALTRSLFERVSLERAIERLGYVQADPIRAPARAQDLILRQRVAGYSAGDLERRYPELDVEEDFFINYGFVSRELHELMHPRQRRALPVRPRTRRDKVLAFVRDRGEAHPRDVDLHFAHGTVTNYWGGSSNATTHLLDGLHYDGLLRVSRRERGIRVYAFRDGRPAGELTPAERIDRLIDIVVSLYAPLPAVSFSFVVRRLRYAVPQWASRIPAALARARTRLRHARVDGGDWYWIDDAGDGSAAGDSNDGRVRFLAPFDPVVWDRRRFERFWGWPYRFEAYTPAPKRQFGYYALPILWRESVVGWANLSVADGALRADCGYVSGRAPRDRGFRRGFEEEMASFEEFLGLPRRTPAAGRRKRPGLQRSPLSRSLS